jgi:hypothetical protein
MNQTGREGIQIKIGWRRRGSREGQGSAQAMGSLSRLTGASNPNLRDPTQRYEGQRHEDEGCIFNRESIRKWGSDDRRDGDVDFVLLCSGLLPRIHAEGVTF